MSIFNYPMLSSKMGGVEVFTINWTLLHLRFTQKNFSPINAEMTEFLTFYTSLWVVVGGGFLCLTYLVTSEINFTLSEAVTTRGT